MKKIKYEIQNLDLMDLCNRFGTPLYLYDADRIKRQFHRFVTAFSGVDHRVLFAVKSCTNLSIMKYMKALGAGIDAVSIPEIQMGLQVGFRPDEMIFTPNMVSFDEIKQAVELGVPVNIDNLQHLESFAKKYRNTCPVCIRLNPNMLAEIEDGSATGIDPQVFEFSSVNKEHYETVSDEQVSAWHHQSKFGISLTQFDGVMDLVERYDLNINGIHLHSSHVILNQEVFERGVKTVFEIAGQFDTIEYVDLGGGMMVRHRPDDEAVDLNDLGTVLKKEYDRYCHRHGRKIKIWFEPGRYLMSEAGVLLTEAVVLKTNGRIDFAGANTGFNHLLRPMMYDAFHEIINISNPQGALQTYNVVGNLCEIDNLGTSRRLNRVRPGDILMIKNVGAYGFSMSSHYNSRPKPAEVLVVNGKAKLIRRRDTFEDLVRNQIEVDF